MLILKTNPLILFIYNEDVQIGIGKRQFKFLFQLYAVYNTLQVAEDAKGIQC